MTTTFFTNVFDIGNLACGGDNNPSFPATWDATLDANEFDGSPGIYTETTVKFFKGVARTS